MSLANGYLSPHEHQQNAKNQPGEYFSNLRKGSDIEDTDIQSHIRLRDNHKGSKLVILYNTDCSCKECTHVLQ